MSAEINRQLEMIRDLSGYEAKFIVWCHLHIKTKQISQDTEKFVFSVLLKQQQNGLETNQIDGLLLTITINNSVALVRERTIPTERPPLVDEVTANILRIEGCRIVSAADPYGRNLVF
jgi:hypothetical protein